jgi:hypothetical protein
MRSRNVHAFVEKPPIAAACGFPWKQAAGADLRETKVQPGNDGQRRLARGIGHELGNLGQVIANAEHLISDPATPPNIVSEACRTLRQAAERCTIMVAMLRTLHRIGDAPPDYRRVCLETELTLAFPHPRFDKSKLGATRTIAFVDPQLTRLGLGGVARGLSVMMVARPAERLDIELVPHPDTNAATIVLGPFDPAVAHEVAEAIERPLQGSQLEQEGRGELFIADQRLAAGGCELRMDAAMLRIVAPTRPPLTIV